jgi:hypothetical protein
MKNKLVDLNNHLFAQLERLGDESLSPEILDHEVKRAHAIASVSTEVMKIASLQLRAAELVAEYGQGDLTHYLPQINGSEQIGAPTRTIVQ